MSRDIRLFFQSKKVIKPTAEEDDDVIPESPGVQIKNKKKEARKKRVLSDSDEEIFSSKKKRPSDEPQKTKNQSKSSSKPALKAVKAVDIFGSAPIKRTEPIVKKIKEKKNTETGIHSDDEFDNSLLELDAVEELALKSYETAQPKDQEKPKANKVDIQKEKSPAKPKIGTDSNRKGDTKEVKIETKSSSSKVKADNENKRKFSEFIEDSNSDSVKDKQEAVNKKKKIIESVLGEKTQMSDKTKKEITATNGDMNNSCIDDSFNDSLCGKSKKKNMNKTLNESVLTDEERHERKMHTVALYQKYLNRSGPKHLGTKEIPEGSPNCLKDCAFLLTGVLDSFEREEVADAIVKYGGCIKNSMSKKVTHVLAGEDAGPAKMAKAQELGIKILNEDEFLQLIKDLTNKKSNEGNSKIKEEKSANNKTSKDKSKKSLNKSNNDITKTKTSQVEHKKEQNTSKEDKKSKEVKKEKGDKISPDKVKTEIKIEKVAKSDVKTDNITNEKKSESCESIQPNNTPSIMWVDKYKPQNIKQIIGQHGDASNVKKLTNWLTKWYVNRKAKLPKPSPWAKNDDGGYYKAALLSGPPGVGKTTTVALVCKELGFDAVEFNASDTRSKTLIKEQISELLTTTSLSGYARGDTSKQAVTKKHVLVMDEVDGMAGNEDRGGLQELIGLIKSSSVPIICMCNDRNSQKMRSLVNYCYDLRFNRPRVDQIKSAMLSICFKEGVKIPPDALSQLIVAANQDVRQTLHLLSVWAADPDTADPDRLRKDSTSSRKDVKLGPWEAVRKVFSAEEHKSMSIHDKSDLFFYDYSLAPLFVQENYLQVVPHCPKKDILDRVSKAADSISLGDLVSARIRGNQAWSLLPVQAMYSSVMPGAAMAGHVAGQIQFPGWLGKNSRATKLHRLCQEIHAHTRLSTSGSKSSIYLDYSSHLRDAIITPLIQDRNDGIAKSMEVLESYHLLRDDLDSLVELSLWPSQRNPMVLVDSKVKAAMTRTYNKSATALPYAPPAARRARVRDDDEHDDELDDEADQPDDSDPENDALIKKKKTKEADKPSTSKDKPSSSKVKKEKKKK